MPTKKGKTARFQVDQVGDMEEVVVEDDHMLTTKSDAVHFTQYHKSLRGRCCTWRTTIGTCSALAGTVSGGS